MTLHAEETDPGAPTDPGELRARTTSTLASVLAAPPVVELTSSCTHALEAAAAVLDIGPGDEVIVPAFTFPSTANPFVLRGARLRFADVDPATCNIDPASVERLIGSRTRAVVCTHYAGVACDMASLLELAGACGADVIEDAAHGLFGSLDGTPLGRFGRLGAISFHRTKNVSTLEGGAIVVNDGDLIDPVRWAIDKGTNRVEFDQRRVTSYEWVGPGSSWRMPDPAVALLSRRLATSEETQRRRHHAWDRYSVELSSWAETHGVRLPSVRDGVEHPAHLFWMVLPEGLPRERFVAHCAAQGVQTARHYGSLPASRYGSRIRHPDDECPYSAQLEDRLVRIPLHHELDDDHLDRVVAAVVTAPAALAEA